MRAAVGHLGGRDAIHACVVLEGTSSGPWLVTHRALGSRRYRVSVRAPGGHSWGDFGAPSAIHELLRLAEPIGRWSLPVRPRASYNIGVINGGASVNTIAEHAQMLLDLRSEDPATLKALARRAERAFEDRAQASPRGVEVTWEVVGDRPAGEIPADHPLVRLTVDALAAAGVPERDIVLNLSSTDANVPLAAGIPAVTLYLTQGGDAHRESEWLSLDRLPMGLAWAWAVVRGAARA
jgi:acetylornithine deacetylase/succinyl-diaminopimelate desuccinylase-like protein